MQRLSPCRLSHAIATVLSFAASFSAFGQVNVEVNDTNIEYVGRWDKSSRTIYHSYWGGAYLRLRFEGATVALNEKTATAFRADIDGAGYGFFAGSAGSVNITPKPLRSGIHVVTIVAAGEGEELQLRGVTLSPGATLLAPAIPDKPLIEFIGDSITCGLKTPDEEIQDYAWLVSERLSCNHTQISYSGITLVDGYHYNYSGAPLRGQSYQYFIMQEPNSPMRNVKWHFANYTPRIVVINLGTNDGGIGVPGAIFETNYISFLRNICATFPNTTVLALRTFYGYYATETRNAVNEVRNAGDKNVDYIDTTGWISSSPYGTNYDTYDGWHPTVAGHRKIAKLLAPVLSGYVPGASTLIRLP